MFKKTETFPKVYGKSKNKTSEYTHSLLKRNVAHPGSVIYCSSKCKSISCTV